MYDYFTTRDGSVFVEKECELMLYKTNVVSLPNGDLEAFLFNPDNSLYPRPIDEIIRDLNLLDNFEKVLCYQYPGVFNNPKMSIRIGEERTIDLYNAYKTYMKKIKADRYNKIK